MQFLFHRHSLPRPCVGCAYLDLLRVSIFTIQNLITPDGLCRIATIFWVMLTLYQVFENEKYWHNDAFSLNCCLNVAPTDPTKVRTSHFPSLHTNFWSYSFNQKFYAFFIHSRKPQELGKYLMMTERELKKLKRQEKDGFYGIVTVRYEVLATGPLFMVRAV